MVSENVDEIVLEANEFTGFVMSDIGDEIWINRFQYDDGSCQKIKVANYLSLAVFDSIKNKKSGFNFVCEKEISAWESLKEYDFTQIELVFEDDSKENYFLSWSDGRNEYENKYQNRAYISDPYFKRDLVWLSVIKNDIERESWIEEMEQLSMAIEIEDEVKRNFVE